MKVEKIYRYETIKTVKDLILDRCQTPGEIRTNEAVVIVGNKVFMINSTISNIFKQIMYEAMRRGYATMICNGRWNIDKPMTFLITDPERPSLSMAESLYAFLYPKKEQPEVEIYEQLKKIKNDKRKFAAEAIRLCGEAGISLSTLLEYIYEKKKWNKEADQDQEEVKDI